MCSACWPKNRWPDDVRNKFEQLLGGTWPVNPGQVYGILQRLERDGLIEPIGERGDRQRLEYQVTDDGQAELNEWLAQPDTDPHQLREAVYLKLLVAVRVGADSTPILLSQQRVFLQRLRDVNALAGKARADGRDDLLLLFRGAALHVEADLKWIDECLDQLPRTPSATKKRLRNQG